MALSVQTVMEKTGSSVNAVMEKTGSGVQTVMEKTGINKVTGYVVQRYNALRNKEEHGEEEVGAQLKQWLEARVLEGAELPEITTAMEDFANHLAALSSEELGSFYQRVNAFCIGMHFDLAWLLDPEWEGDTQLKQTLTQAVLFYALADYHASCAKDTVQLMGMLHAWQREPMAEQHRALIQKLFLKLIEQKYIPEPSAAVLLFSEEERHVYVVNAINKVAEQHMPVVLGLIKEG